MVFLLSPADCGGARARLVRNVGSRFDLARRLRSDTGAPLGEVFSFMSGLYFRGKLAYARAFGRSPTGVETILIITPSDGLKAPEEMITLNDLERYAIVPVATTDERYRRPLLRDSKQLADRLGADCTVVLLGSIATNKYLDILGPAFGARLRVPRAFVGRGDMSRGALLLRCVSEGRELDYAGMDEVSPRPQRGS